MYRYKSNKLTLPPVFERVLLSYLKINYLKKGLKESRWNKQDAVWFSRGITALNQHYTFDRHSKHYDYFTSPVMRSGYLAYFLPVNATKIYGLLRHDPLVITESREFKIVDIGAGPLTLSIGFILHLVDVLKHSNHKVKVTIDAFELNKNILKDGIKLLSDYLKASGLNNQISVVVNSFTGNIFKQKLPFKKYNYIFLGNFLNEFEKRHEQWHLVRNVLNKFTQEGTKVLFLEPGSKKISRDLLFLRDEILDLDRYTVLAPCLHQNKCPLNMTAKSDWCSFTQDWRAPGFIKDFDQLTELKKQYLLYSYLLLQKGKVKRKHDHQDFIAISTLMHQKGRSEVIGCGQAGRIRFIRSNKDRSIENSRMDTLDRGHYFTKSDYKHKGGYLVNHNEAVKKKSKIS